MSTMWKAVRVVGLVLLGSMAMTTGRSGAQDRLGIERPKTKEFMYGTVEPRIGKRENPSEGQRGVHAGHQPKVESLIHEKFPPGAPALPNPRRSAVDKGYPNPSVFHNWDKDKISAAFAECFGVKEVDTFGCVCVEEEGLTGMMLPDPQPMHEYWWPVSKVENVDKPLKTGYFKPEVMQEIRENSEETYFTPRLILTWAADARQRVIESSGFMTPPPAAPGPTPDPASMPDPMHIREINEDANWRTWNPASGSVHNDFHAMVEPYGRTEAYWENAEACHWNLPGGMDPSSNEVDPAQSFLSESREPGAAPGFLHTRNATIANAGLQGRDSLRSGLGYDHNGGWYNGGHIAAYLAHRREGEKVNPPQGNNRFECSRFYMNGEGRTPADMLKPMLVPGTGLGDIQQSGCLPENMGEWVPTRNTAQTLYHSVAALVGTMRGLKLAYYNFPPDGNCKGQQLLDSWGWYFDAALFTFMAGLPAVSPLYCYNPYEHGGTFYDFEPQPYTVAFADHPSIPKLIEPPLVADKVLSTLSGEMPKECMALIQYFSDLETSGMPNKQEIGEPNPISPEVIDPLNVIAQWRFFRTCPKQRFNQQLVNYLNANQIPVEKRGDFIAYAGTNTAYCCAPDPLNVLALLAQKRL